MTSVSRDTDVPNILVGECMHCRSIKCLSFRTECTQEEKVTEGDGLRKRNVSVLTPLYHRDDDEEEEEAEEEQFRHPQREREGDFGFTLNKCIFGALILLGLGTIFFSGKIFIMESRL